MSSSEAQGENSSLQNDLSDQPKMGKQRVIKKIINMKSTARPAPISNRINNKKRSLVFQSDENTIKKQSLKSKLEQQEKQKQSSHQPKEIFNEIFNLNTKVRLFYDPKKDPLTSIKVVSYAEHKPLQIAKKNPTKCVYVSAQFSLTKKDLLQMSQEQIDEILPFQQKEKQEGKESIHEEGQKSYPFTVFLKLKFNIQNDRSKPNQEKQACNLFPENLQTQKQSNQLHQQLRQAYVKALKIIKEQKNITDGRLSIKNYICKQLSLQLTSLMLQNVTQETSHLINQDVYWKVVQKYYKKTIAQHKSIDKIINRDWTTILQFLADPQEWKIFKRFLVFDAFRPDYLREIKNSLAIEAWNQFKELYFSKNKSIFQEPENSAQNDGLKQQSVNSDKKEIALTQTKKEKVRQRQRQKQKEEEHNEKDQIRQKKYFSGLLLPENTNQSKLIENIQKDDGNECQTMQLKFVQKFIFEQNLLEVKDLANLIKRKQVEKGHQKKIWDKKEIKRSIGFIVFHHEEIVREHQRRNGCLNVMSKIIETRNPKQCQWFLGNPREKYSLKNETEDFIKNQMKTHQITETDIIESIKDQIEISRQVLILNFEHQDMYRTNKSETPEINFIAKVLEKSFINVNLFKQQDHEDLWYSYS